MSDVDWELVGSKLGMAAAVLLVGLVCGMAPLATKGMNVTLRDRILGVANAFAAGIFLAAGFVHLLNEGIELFAEVSPLDINLALLVAPVGFFVTFIIDKVIFLRDTPAAIHEHVFATPQRPGYGSVEEKQEENAASPAFAPHLHDQKVNLRPSSAHRDDDSVHELFDDAEEDNEHGHGHRGQPGPAHGHSHGLTVDSSGRPSLSNYVLVAVLSFHSILAGFVIGLDQSLSSAVAVFVALISHHWIESFALGVALVRSAVRTRPMFFLILFFSVMAPTGILGGMLVAKAVDEAEVLEAWCISFAAGTFLYVAIVDILLEEFAVARDKWVKVVALALGFVLDAAIVLFFEQAAHSEEGHSH